MAYYVETSAALKLVVKEPKTRALRRWLDARVRRDLERSGADELLRATRRAAPELVPQARAVLDSIALMTVPTDLFERAAMLEPELLRSFDALHLAAALTLGDDLDGIVTYDDRLATAARAHGVEVVAPGA